MTGLFSGLCFLLTSVSSIIIWVIIIHAIMSWLITFNIVNMHNPFMYQIYMILDRLTEPMLRPIRRFMPDLGGIDLSPIVLYIGVQFIVAVASPYVCYVRF